MNKMQKGFTLIELMIVIAIIGILAAVAVPQYQTYTLRATVATQSTAAMRPLQNAIAEFAARKGSLPADFDDLVDVGFVATDDGLAAEAADLASGNVESIDWDGTDITVTFTGTGSTELDDQTLDITASLNNVGAVVFWIDTAKNTADTAVSAQYRPTLGEEPAAAVATPPTGG